MSDATDEGEIAGNGDSFPPGAQLRIRDVDAHADGSAETDPRREIVSADPDDRREILEEFGPYVVYELLGQGGMATVHRAEKRGVGIRRPIALKRLLPHGADDPELVKLFVDEARLASYLHHANVAQTYELGRVGDTYFIAMEYASGPTLSQIVRQCQKAAGPIPIAITANILAQVCDALDYAHNCCDESGRPLRIIHRDVSPGNIVVTNSGVVKLIDFGIAKATISSVQTQIGFIKGKFGYIAPEYITGKIDSRVDLFAVGVIAHELLSGRRLFEGKDDFETLSNIRDMVIRRPSSWNRHVTPDLDDIVMTALSRNPAKRWQTAGAMRVALTNLSRQLGVVVGPLQVVEWVQWAFSQVPYDSPPVVRAPTNGSDTATALNPAAPSAAAQRDSGISIQFGVPSESDRFALPPAPLRARSPSDADATMPVDRLAVDALEPTAPMPRRRPPSPPPPRSQRTAPSDDPVAAPPPPSHSYQQAIVTPPERVRWPSHVDDPADVPAGDKPPMWLSPADAAAALAQEAWQPPTDDADDAIATPKPVLRLPPADNKPVVLRPEQEPWPSHTEEVDPGAIDVAPGTAPLWLLPADAAVELPPEREPWPTEADPGATAIAGAQPLLWIPPADAAVAAPPDPAWASGIDEVDLALSKLVPWQDAADEAASAAQEPPEPSPAQTLRAVVPPVPASQPHNVPEAMFDPPTPPPAALAKPGRARTVPPTAKIKPRPRPQIDVVKPAAPRQRGTALWLLLLMIALGAAAMATAYFWPSGL